jgi:hypothetical protein
MASDSCHPSPDAGGEQDHGIVSRRGTDMPWYKIAYKPEPNTVVHILWPLGLHPDREAALACFNAQEPNTAGIGPFKLDNTVAWSNYSLIEQQVLKGPEVMYSLDKV